MPKSAKRKNYFSATQSANEKHVDLISAKRRRRMAELEMELAALKAAEMSTADTTPTPSPTPSCTPPPPKTPQEELFARLPQSRAKTILGMALRLPMREV